MIHVHVWVDIIYYLITKPLHSQVYEQLPTY